MADADTARTRRHGAALVRAFARLLPQVLEHAQREHPREACGLVLREGSVTRYVACRNVAPLAHQGDRFELDPRDWAAAEDAGTVLAVVHSHPDSDANPSEADRWLCHASGLPWFVVAWPGAAWQPLWPQPLPLVGRQFEHGVVDCYTLVRDYYAQRLGIELPNFERDDEWWRRGGN
ncbi:MAG: C40 family peptidase, partial [Aquabacterium sp.]